MSDIQWQEGVEAKFKEIVAHLPLFHRRIAEKLVGERAVMIAREKNLSLITEREVVEAFFKEVPPAFRGLMKKLLTEAHIDYKKYVDED